MEIRLVVMAGGAGTRFWPLTRMKKPKQFLPIVSHRTMIEETIERLLNQFPPKNIYTIANYEQTQTIKALVPQLPVENLLIEPQGKNTAPSLMLATAKIYLQNSKAVIVSLPADHLIKKSSLFLKKLEAAAEAAAKGEFIITFGIRPTYPATGFGYIQLSKKNPDRIQTESFYTVKKFKEKPEPKQAKNFLKKGNYYWNSGMFVWQADIFAGKLAKYAPSLFPYWKRIINALKNNNEPAIKTIFAEIPSISIDYALMEKAEGILMAEGNFGWSDVGAWSSLADIWPKDKQGNALRGESILLDSQNCLVYNPKKLTALVGVKDLIVIETEDALLISHKSQDQKVKDLLKKIQQKGKIKYL
jgi:mannose-1-phosphate guanylyltransferase